MRRRFSGAAGNVCATGAWGIVVGSLVVVGACGSDKTNTTTPLVATTLSVNSAVNAQTGVVGTALAQPISVQVLDQNGAPLNNAVVTWTVESGGGSVATPTTSTDASGTATVAWTLGTAAGLDSLKAAIASGMSVFATATATAASASAIQIRSGGTQTVTAGSQTAPMAVKVVDQFANPIANATVSWSVVGGGSLSSTSTTTDSTGTTQVVLTTDAAPAVYQVMATTGSMAPVTFGITSM
jgi:hypothetical protein